MTQTQDLEMVGNLFSFSGKENSSARVVADGNLFRITKKENDPPTMMELPVNNYLKTPEEIETDFHRANNSRKAAFQERKNSLDNNAVTISEANGYMNVLNLDVTLSGFMEENY